MNVCNSCVPYVARLLSLHIEAKLTFESQCPSASISVSSVTDGTRRCRASGGWRDIVAALKDDREQGASLLSRLILPSHGHGVARNACVCPLPVTPKPAISPPALMNCATNAWMGELR